MNSTLSIIVFLLTISSISRQDSLYIFLWRKFTMANALINSTLFLTMVEVSSLGFLNILVCISVYKNNQLPTTTNLYIIALVLSDLISAAIIMPFSTTVLIASNWVFGSVFVTCFVSSVGLYLHFTIDDGSNGFQRIHENLQIGAAVQENIFTAEVARFAGICVDFCRLLHCNTKVSWYSRFCIRSWIRPVCSNPPHRNRKIISLCFCSHFLPVNLVTNNNI